MYHIVFLGDSTLDNIVWVDTPTDCVKSQLQKILPESTVTNYAADGFTSSNTLHGAFPIISVGERKNSGDPYPPLENGLFLPLVHLKRLNCEKKVSHVVVSVGGNDIREILGHMEELPVRVSAFLRNYPKILDKVKEVTPNVILMLQYRPSFYDDQCYGVYKAMSQIGGGDPVVTLNTLMEEIYPPIIKLARTHKLAIIDLPNTFDIYNTTLYKTQIEPSAKGGELITQLIHHVVKSHDFNGCSKFYFKENDEIRESVNEGVWKIKSENNQNSLVTAYIQGLIAGENDSGELQEQGEFFDMMSENIAKLRELGFGNSDEELVRCLNIDGTLETAISALF